MDSSLEDGIYGMVITLCKDKATRVGDEAARAEVAAWLTEVAATLLTLNQEST